MAAGAGAGAGQSWGAAGPMKERSGLGYGPGPGPGRGGRREGIVPVKRPTVKDDQAGRAARGRFGELSLNLPSQHSGHRCGHVMPRDLRRRRRRRRTLLILLDQFSGSKEGGKHVGLRFMVRHLGGPMLLRFSGAVLPSSTLIPIRASLNALAVDASASSFDTVSYLPSTFYNSSHEKASVSRGLRLYHYHLT